jgi:nuclear pore complex protein Nup133
MAHEIFKQSDQQLDYVDAFFTTYEYPSLSWLHQIGKKQFTAASTTLLNLAQSETRLGPAKFMLSMGKLCELVELENSEDVREMEAEIQVYDELLDLVDVQQKLRKDLMETVSQVDISFSITDEESQNAYILARASAITEHTTTRLTTTGRSESAILFKRLVANLIGDQRLGVEDTLDLLALKDDASDIGDYAVGLHLIYEAKAWFLSLTFILKY